jgi:hypothetical protein
VKRKKERERVWERKRRKRRRKEEKEQEKKEEKKEEAWLLEFILGYAALLFLHPLCKIKSYF